MRSPKVRNSAVEKTEAAWFDPDADVVVLVQGSKKAASQNVLKALLKK